VTLTIPDFSRLNMVVAGDAMLDEYWFGDTGRISPEAPVPVVNAGSAERRAGGAANVALNLAALGAKVRLVAVVGKDERGEYLAGCLQASGVQCDLHRSPDLPTIHKLRVLARNQQLIRVDSERRLDGCAAEFKKLFKASLAGADVVILSDYGKGTLSRIAELIALCRAAAVPVLIDPKGRDFAPYRGATALTPNLSEFAAVAGTWASETEFLTKAQALRDELELDMLLVTRGDKGMVLVPAGMTPIALPAQAREVFDVTGAGDTVIALLGAALAVGMAAGDAVALANLGAGLVVGKIGVATVSRSELRLALHQRGGGRGVVALDELEVLVAEAKARGRRVVFTNGCFDILHAGHVSYLEEAKALGDELIVAVNDDASVKRLKGEERPITPLADRMAVLAGLAAVDWVVSFTQDTPAEVIERILPNVLVKGGDWRPEDIVGGDVVRGNGGEVRVLTFKEGRSTSALIEAIRGRHD
jgi:D-beta-D-heptose 7-phosphate kinase/D-beta-D-heptose 1-phosphate adenosyltransferase